MSEDTDDARQQLAAILLGQGRGQAQSQAQETIDYRSIRALMSLLTTDALASFAGGDRETRALLETLNAQREHHDRLAILGETSAGVVHEVRNWVASMRGFADLARQKDAPAEVVELIDKIYDLTGRCAERLSDFLGFARGAEGNAGPTGVASVIQKARVLARHQLETHNIQLTTRVADDLPLAVACARELSQVLLNLAINAQQAMANGGRVEFVARAEPGAVLIDVIDDGPGVPEALRSRIFEPFFTTKPAEIGTGLGLAICARLIRGCGGEIEVGDSDWGGARFTIRLPRAEQD